MTTPSRRRRQRTLARAPVTALVVLGLVVGACAPPLQRKPIEMTPIGTVPILERTVADEPDAGPTTSPNSGTGASVASAKEAACTMAEVDSLEPVLRNCDSPVPKAGDVPPGLGEKLEFTISSSTPSTTPGGRVDVTLTVKNRTNEALALYFAGEGKPRFEVEAFDAKGKHRVDIPTSKPPRTAYPPTRAVKAARITLLGGGSVRVRLQWIAVKTRWAPDSVKTWNGRGPARAVFADLPYGKYQLRVAIPIILAEKGGLELPMVGVDIVK